ncbi:ubiquitin-conjugating enzyme E2 protein [Rutstroemia sp. NJR-2017a WRK4]|nr:ubiquitin-conjugating enzyme E2 protein [Rutstroemia sp. NJR-2017a WRK4]
MSSAAASLLGRQLKEIQKAKDLPGISCGLRGDNVFEWEVMLMISDECKYYGGVLCISILHAPGDDEYGYEKAAERWTPVQTPETILLSVVSLFNDPNDESPANLEAAKMWREAQKDEKTMKEWKRKCRRLVRESLGEE